MHAAMVKVHIFFASVSSPLYCLTHSCLNKDLARAMEITVNKLEKYLQVLIDSVMPIN